MKTTYPPPAPPSEDNLSNPSPTSDYDLVTPSPTKEDNLFTQSPTSEDDLSTPSPTSKDNLVGRKVALLEVRRSIGKIFSPINQVRRLKKDVKF